MPAIAAEASATDSRSGFADGSAERPRKEKCQVPAACAASASSAAQSAIRAVIGLAGAIPFDQREFGMHAARRARDCEKPWRTRRCGARRRREASCRRIPARCADRAGPRSPSGAASAVAKACRWVSLPGETASAPVSTSTKSFAANQRRKAAVMRTRASSAGRRSAWTCGAQKGEELGTLSVITLSARTLRK